MRAAAPSGPLERRRLRLLALTVACAFLMETLDATIVVAAMPAIAADFGIAPLRVHLAVSLYLVTLAAMIPASAWLADRFGARRVFLTALVLFMLASLGAALSSGLNMLLSMRVLQGAAAAMMTPIGRLLLIRAAPREQLAFAISWMSMPALIGPLLGPLLGGWLVTHASWPWIFLINLPIGLGGLIAASRVLPKDAAGKVCRFDWRGFALIALLLCGAQLLLEQLVHPWLPRWGSLAAVATLLLAGFAFGRHARRSEHPLVLDLSLLRIDRFRTALLTGGLSRLGLNAVPFLLQLQLQLGFGWSAARAGSCVFTIAAGAILLKPLMHRVIERCGLRRVLALNALLGALLTALLGLVTAATPVAWLLALMLAYGVSRSLQFNAVNTLLYIDVSDAQKSAGTALGSVGQQLSMALGISIASVLVAQFGALSAAPLYQAIAAALFAVAAITWVSGLLFWRLPRPRPAAQPASE